MGGFSVVEILIAMLLGLVVISGIVYLYVGTTEAYRFTDDIAELNDSGRFAVDFIANDVRMAGYLSCGGTRSAIASTVNNLTDWPYLRDTIVGYEGGVSTFPADFADNVMAGTDAVILHRADVARTYSVSTHDANAATLQVTGEHDFKVGEIVVLDNADCDQAAIFQISGIVETDDPVVGDDIKHQANADGLTPGNCVTSLRGAFTCADTSPASNNPYSAGSSLTRMLSHAYYVADTDPPALVRVELTHDGSGAATTQTVSILENVEDMQIVYGVNTNQDGQYLVDSYVTADQVTNWDDVLSVRIALLARSSEKNIRTETDSGIYALAGTDIDPDDDRRVRRVFSTVVSLRNRLP